MALAGLAAATCTGLSAGGAAGLAASAGRSSNSAAAWLAAGLRAATCPARGSAGLARAASWLARLASCGARLAAAAARAAFDAWLCAAVLPCRPAGFWALPGAAAATSSALPAAGLSFSTVLAIAVSVRSSAASGLYATGLCAAGYAALSAFMFNVSSAAVSAPLLMTAP